MMNRYNKCRGMAAQLLSDAGRYLEGGRTDLALDTIKLAKSWIKEMAKCKPIKRRTK